jgi:hypothetical protein
MKLRISITMLVLLTTINVPVVLATLDSKVARHEFSSTNKPATAPRNRLQKPAAKAEAKSDTLPKATAPKPAAAKKAPPGATAECVDGTFSFSQNNKGTCSDHGGVRRWLKKP